MQTISIVMPVRNEHAVIDETLTALADTLKDLPYEFELVLVDDGSTDTTWKTIKSTKVPFSVHALRFSRNFGKENAIMAGLRASRGDAAIVMDSDLQHPPTVIPKLLTHWRNTNCAVVHARKKGRANESDTRIGPVNLFYRLYRITTGIDITQASDFKLLDRHAIDTYTTFSERTPFFRGLVPWMGHAQETITFTVDKRSRGTSKWNLFQRMSLATHAITTFSTIPLQLVTISGVFFFCIAMGIGVHTLYMWATGQSLEGFTTIILLLLFVSSILMFSLGIIGQYLAHIHSEIKRRPSYIVEDSHHGDPRS